MSISAHENKRLPKVCCFLCVLINSIIGEVSHLEPVAVVHLISDVRCVRADRQLDGGGHRKPPPLHAEGHEAGAEHRRPHVHEQVGDIDVRLPGDDNEHRVKLNHTMWPWPHLYSWLPYLYLFIIHGLCQVFLFKTVNNKNQRRLMKIKHWLFIVLNPLLKDVSVSTSSTLLLWSVFRHQPCEAPWAALSCPESYDESFRIMNTGSDKYWVIQRGVVLLRGTPHPPQTQTTHTHPVNKRDSNSGYMRDVRQKITDQEDKSTCLQPQWGPV